MPLRRELGILLLALATCVVAAACGSAEPSRPTAAALVVPSGAVSAAVVAGGVSVTNNTSDRVAFEVWDVGFLGQLGQCASPEPSCTRLAAGASHTVPNEEIAAFGTTGSVAVHWWHVLRSEAGGHVAGELHTIVLPTERK
ncbi:MAG: hypothetical protein WD825_01465 [Gemmatimonadaceae bacterium]